MFIKSIRLENYRNHKFLEIHKLAHTNLITGPNASGKSNVVEAILRFNTFNKNKNGAVRFGKSRATVQIEVQVAEVSAKHILVAEKHQEEVSVCIKQPLGKLPIVYYAPQDHDLFGGTPHKRRQFLDEACSLFVKTYKKDLLDYQRVVRQKNDVLKRGRGRDKNLIATFNQQLAEKAERVISKRLRILGEVGPVLGRLYQKLTEGPQKTSLCYESKTEGDNIKESLLEQIEKKSELEAIRCCCLAGPHRDDFSLAVEGIDVASFGSQGEKRTACLALKVALIELLQKKGIKPLLILDDALSELDDRRRQLLLETISRCGQVFITATDADNLELGTNIKKFELGPTK